MKLNSELKATIMEVVGKQISNDDPPETRQTLERLVAEQISEEDAKIYIGQAISIEIWDIINYKKEFNQNRYLRNLKKLPAEPRQWILSSTLVEQSSASHSPTHYPKKR